MPVRSRSLVAGLGMALLAAGLLTACATPAGDSGSTSGTPSETAPAGSTEIEVEAAWLDGGRMIGLVTEGSSTCVPTAGEVAYDNGVLEVEFIEPPADTACTRDLVPRVTVVGLPEGVDTTRELEVRVTGEGYHGEADLDPVPGLDQSGETDYLPSAGWTDKDGQFVILTWGSSTCVPVIENVEGAGAEVTVTFATPPADQPCTADMAPRGVVAQVEGVDDDAEVFAILTGGEFDNVRVPIIGHE
ncbi:hypothetical protein [Microbacterium atlanticum]|uniref:hypothetical protein n=1 Tax=Microbacterium atlanticum TaxID=2782168 RepID=UPI0018895CF5|nr:hypothetical protein [Microbacterium atlanticum]